MRELGRKLYSPHCFLYLMREASHIFQFILMFLIKAGMHNELKHFTKFGT